MGPGGGPPVPRPAFAVGLFVLMPAPFEIGVARGILCVRSVAPDRWVTRNYSLKFRAKEARHMPPALPDRVADAAEFGLVRLLLFKDPERARGERGNQF